MDFYTSYLSLLDRNNALSSQKSSLSGNLFAEKNNPDHQRNYGYSQHTNHQQSHDQYHHHQSYNYYAYDHHKKQAETYLQHLNKSSSIVQENEITSSDLYILSDTGPVACEDSLASYISVNEKTKCEIDLKENQEKLNEIKGAGNSFSFGNCKVCLDKATGIHYGISTCEGCKVLLLLSDYNRKKFYKF